MLADIKQVRNFSGEGFFQLNHVGPFKSIGESENITTTVNVTPDDYFSSRRGKRRKADSDTLEETVTGSAVLRETGPLQLAMAMLANVASLTQEAKTGEILSGTAEKGDVLFLGDSLNVTISSITDGSDPLKEGDDYEFDAGSGMLIFNRATSYDITYNVAAIIETDNRAIIAALSATGGIEGTFRVVQFQKRGPSRFRWTAKVKIYPNGDVQYHNDAGDKITMSVRFDVLEDMSKPEGKRFGYLEEIKN